MSYSTVDITLYPVIFSLRNESMRNLTKVTKFPADLKNMNSVLS